MRPDVSTVNDNDVFLPTNDDNAACHEIANVSGIKPPIRRQDLPSFSTISEVAGHDVGAPHKDRAGVAVRENLTLLISHLDLNPGKRRTAIDKSARIRPIHFRPAPTSIERHRHSTFGQRRLLNTISSNPFTEGCKTDGEGRLCHTIAGQKCTWLKPAQREGCRKLLQDIRPNRFGAYSRGSPRAEIELAGIIPSQTSRTHLVPERRTEGDGSPCLRHQGQPQSGSHGKGPRFQVVY